MLCLALVLPAYAPPPLWWSENATRIVANPPVTPDNYGVANLGQLKHVAAMAKKHLDQHLATWGGAGSGVNAVVASFVQNTPDNFAPVNLGQLKAVAKPFYDRLREVGMNTNASLRANGYPASWPHDYPWDPTLPINQPTPPGATVDKTANLAPINLGQLKMVFSFDLAKDTDGDGLPDWWERKYGLNPNNPSDANATAAGGGMTNGQHFGQGSNPNQAPPPATIAAAVPTLDQNADTLLYPADDSTLLLKNGNFSTPAVPARNWDTYPGIVGWTAISGNLIEIQKIVPNPGGQYCELDSHWHDDNPTHTGASDHGIQQTVSLNRGHYILIFDYRARQVNATTTAGNFTVKVKSDGGSEVTLVAKNGAATAWKRAITSFDVSRGNPNLAQLPVTLKFDIADAADSYGAFIDNVILLRIEVKVHKLNEEPPEDGILIKKGDTLVYEIPGIPESLAPQPLHVTFERRVIEPNGQMLDLWSSISAGANIGKSRLEENEGTPGIYEVRAIVTYGGPGTKFYYTRKRDDPHGKSSSGVMNPMLKAGQPDYVGVAEGEAQLGIARKAREKLGSTAWALASNVTVSPTATAGPGDNKCNVFVYQVCQSAGVSVPLDAGGWPPRAYDWFNSGFPIAGWSFRDLWRNPSPGQVVSRYLWDWVPIVDRIPGTSAHVGIVDYDGSWINAGPANINRYPHINNNDYQTAHYRQNN
jgi:hypothetical protein